MPFTRAIVFLIVLIPAIAAGSNCERLPPSAISPVDELIARSTRIALVTFKASSESAEASAEKPTGEPLIDLEAEKRRATQDDGPAPDLVRPAMRLARLVVVENLSGNGPPEIYKPSAPVTKPQHDYSGHTAEAFWDDPAEGLVHLDDHCRPQMHFEPGKTYLLFEGPAHVKSSELIESEDDAWLAYVRARLDE
jgi:hypothetical protein